MNHTAHSMGLLTSLILITLLNSGCSSQNARKELRNKVFKGSPTMKSILQNRHGPGSTLTPPSLSAPAKPHEYRQAPDWSTKPASNAYRTAVFIPAGDTNHKAYSRTEKKALNGLFPRLPNPDLCMYVFPHLTSEHATVPGYTSCFALYDTNQYALPGEMSAIWQNR